jgi:hypothetical protein
MDPLSVTASIIAILQLSNKVMGYLNDVKDAPKERRRCAIEITNLHSLLTNLRFRVEDGDPSTPWFDRIRELAKKGEALDHRSASLEVQERRDGSHHEIDRAAEITRTGCDGDGSFVTAFPLLLRSC